MALQIKRRNTGASGNPSALKSGQMAWAGPDKRLVLGHGDDGAGNATSIEDVGGVGAFMTLSTAQTIGGTKTFSASPLVPTATQGDSSTKAASTAFVMTAVAGFAAGDMSKSTYDSNNDGKVNSADSADAVPWTGVTGKPATFAPAAHDANLITSGTIDVARLPVLPSSVQVVSTGGIAALDAGQQANIGDGSVVTTTDGRRWIYTGSGSKTAEASYIEMADITPDWSVIANKPTTRAGYGITDAQPLDGTLTALAAMTVAVDQIIYSTGADAFAVAAFPAQARTLLAATTDALQRTALGLGSIATQSSSNVNITGGSISGVNIDDGTF